jgi:hypothetical protein
VQLRFFKVAPEIRRIRDENGQLLSGLVTSGGALVFSCTRWVTLLDRALPSCGPHRRPDGGSSIVGHRSELRK